MSKQADPEFEKLRRLLALKRHEHPPRGYFENFLAEFHRRQRAEPIRAQGWWEQLVEFFHSEPLLAARYALGAAVVLLLGANAYLLSQRPAQRSPAPVVAETYAPQPPPSVFAENTARPALTDLTERVTASPQFVSNVQSRASSQYILDRVNVSPASYDTTGDF